METSLTIFFPCYNSSSFIKESFKVIDQYITDKPFIQVTFIEDCGPDNTYELLQELAATAINKARFNVLKNSQNLGKGGTIKRAVSICTTPVMVFTDPDLAYDMSNIDTFYSNMGQGKMLIANRVHHDSRYLIPPSFFRYIFTRHLSSRIYNKMAQILLISGIEDNQAGLKMFNINEIKPLIAKSKQNDFSFDLELLVMAQCNNIDIVGMPVNFKYDHETTTVTFLFDSIKLFKSLLKIFYNKITNHYKT